VCGVEVAEDSTEESLEVGVALTVTVMVGIGEGHAVVAVALGLADAAFPTEAVGCAEHPAKANALSATATRTFFILPPKIGLSALSSEGRWRLV
jgi:hypothetical protein